MCLFLSQCRTNKFNYRALVVFHYWYRFFFFVCFENMFRFFTICYQIYCYVRIFVNFKLLLFVPCTQQCYTCVAGDTYIYVCMYVHIHIAVFIYIRVFLAWQSIHFVCYSLEIRILGNTIASPPTLYKSKGLFVSNSYLIFNCQFLPWKSIVLPTDNLYEFFVMSLLFMRHHKVLSPTFINNCLLFEHSINKIFLFLRKWLATNSTSVPSI